MSAKLFALVATQANAPYYDSARSRLHALVASVRETHGGPAYISGADLDSACRAAEETLGEAEDEEAYASACALVMGALRDPLASHLRPAQAVAARERFHGRTSLGLSLHMCIVPGVQLGSSEGRATTSARSSWWWSRRSALPRWRRAALVTQVREGSPAARAGIREGDELLEVGDTEVAGQSRAAALSLLDEGPEGSAVRLRLRTPDEHARGASAGRAGRTVCLRREATPPPTVVSRPIARGHAQLVVISSFSATTAAELRDALRALQRIEPRAATRSDFA